MVKLIIQIPCFNEEQSLPEVMRDLPKSIPGVDVIETLVIDDGSKDRTVEVAQQLGVNHIVRHVGNKGLAAAFQTGLNACLRHGADIIVNTDGDNQYPGEQIPALIQPILARQADMVIGDRQVQNVEHFSGLKKRLQGFGSWVVRRVSGTEVPDAVSGFRAFSREAALQLNVITNFTYTTETIIQAGKKNLAVAYVPISVNQVTRPSRLMRSTWDFMKKQGSTILRMFALYEPLKIFFYVSLVFLIVGAFYIVRFGYWYFFNHTESDRHVQSTIFGTTAFMLGIIIFLFGIVADVIAASRRLTEETLYRSKKMELEMQKLLTEQQQTQLEILKLRQELAARDGVPPAAPSANGSAALPERLVTGDVPLPPNPDPEEDSEGGLKMATQIQNPPPAEAEAQPRNLALVSIRPANLLSFAPDTPPLTLEPLNILIGANGSGKSNLLDAIGLLQAAALGELTDRVVVKGRGVAEWIWKRAGAERTAKLEALITYYGSGRRTRSSDKLRYDLNFGEGSRHEIRVSNERLESAGSRLLPVPLNYAKRENGSVSVFSRQISRGLRKLKIEQLTSPDARTDLSLANAQESMLSQRWNTGDQPELAYVSQLFASFRLYRDWSFGRNSSVRDDKRVGILEDQLDEDAGNLGLILNNLRDDEKVEDNLAKYLNEFLEDARRFSTKVVGQHIQYGLSEVGLKGITPAGRLSDGTLRWFALMAVLLNPTPPPLICLEEPESGLHPNIIPVLAELLLDASQRTQVVVTTHSRGLVDRFTDTPENVVVFDREDGATKMRRLPAIGELRDWLDEYESLGPLWASGLIGGNRF